MLASLVGIVAGLAAIAFEVLTQVVIRFSLVEFAGCVPAEAVGDPEETAVQAPKLA